MSDLIKAITNHDIVLLWGTVLSLLIGLFRLFPKCYHKRYRNGILHVTLIFGVIWTVYCLALLSITVASALTALLGSYLFLAFYGAKKAFVPESWPISLLESLVKEGNYQKIENRFSKKPFYVRSVTGKIKWNLGWANKFIEQNRPKEAYEIYSKLLYLPLFKEEENDIKLKQVLTLLLLGDTNKAKSIFKLIDDKSDHFLFNECLFLEALFDEREGDFEKARQSLLSAVGKYDNNKDIQLAKIYNNLGRMEKMLGNRTNATHYYLKSAELAAQFKKKSLIHIVYPNIIDSYLLLADNQKAIEFLIKYSELIDKDNIDDMLAFNNYGLEYARQIKIKVLLLDTIVKGRINILPKLSAQERLVFEISELRIRWSHQCGWDEKLFWLRYHFQEYLKLEFPTRFYMLKEIFIILRDLARTNNLGPFGEFFIQLLGFMGSSKEDISRYLLELPDCCVDERCYWEKEQAFLRRVQRTNAPQLPLREYCEELFMHLQNIKDIQLQNGNPLPAIEADLNIADECMALILEIGETDIEFFLRKTMEKHLSDACKDMQKFRRHPATNEYALRAARYALFLGDRKMAKEYLDDFVQSKVSINHYAIWIQMYYQELIHENLGNDA